MKGQGARKYAQKRPEHVWRAAAETDDGAVNHARVAEATRSRQHPVADYNPPRRKI